jgi:hypothetical protein
MLSNMSEHQTLQGNLRIEDVDRGEMHRRALAFAINFSNGTEIRSAAEAVVIAPHFADR